MVADLTGKLPVEREEFAFDEFEDLLDAMRIDQTAMHAMRECRA